MGLFPWTFYINSYILVFANWHIIINHNRNCSSDFKTNIRTMKIFISDDGNTLIMAVTSHSLDILYMIVYSTTTSFIGDIIFL